MLSWNELHFRSRNDTDLRGSTRSKRSAEVTGSYQHLVDRAQEIEGQHTRGADGQLSDVSRISGMILLLALSCRSVTESVTVTEVTPSIVDNT